MGCFNDLPKDVKWLIFRRVITNDFFGSQIIGGRYVFFESGPVLGFNWNDCIGRLATISKQTLRLIQNKTYRVGSGFLFVKGSFS